MTQDLAAKKQALLALRRQAIPSPSAGTRDAIAVVGLSCRFPGGENPRALWETLCRGADVIREVPPDRWDIDAYYDPDPDAPGKMYSRWGGFLPDITRFDAAFFGISPREAAEMDPQQRLLLEVTWEALESAGQSAERLRGSATGVFVGLSSGDYSHRLFFNHNAVEGSPHMLTGNAASVAAGRLSYFLGLNGPSLVIDTACSSSLVAVHLACQSLSSGETNLAIAGGVNVILSPLSTVNFCKLRALSPDGRCKAFAAGANGYVRGEGCGVVVLKRLTDAVIDGDNVLAVIRSSAVNQDGRSSSLTVPSGRAQQALIAEALERAGLAPRDISFVEAHGTGTSLGDPIELRALGAALAPGRDGREPVWIGSIKSNMGHLEASAGVAGLIKAVLALQHRTIPPSLHCEEPTPHVDWSALPLRVATACRRPADDSDPLFAGVSSFSFGGTNAHVILGEAPARRRKKGPEGAAAYLLPLSARSESALRELAGAFEATLAAAAEEDRFYDALHSAALRRTHHPHRLAVVGGSPAAMLEAMRAYAAGAAAPGLSAGANLRGEAPKTVFLFSGHGGQWLGMGRDLLARYPAFASAFAECEAACAPYIDWSLREVLEGTLTPAERFERVEVIQPSIFAVQVALAALWRHFGVIPDAVVGQSMGEAAAAHVAGALTLAEAARLICVRSRMMREVRGTGAMLVVEKGPSEIPALLAGHEAQVSLASVNSARSCVLSGDAAAIARIRERLDAEGTFCRPIKIDAASHCPATEILLPRLREALADLRPQRGDIRIFSTVRAAAIEGTQMDADYWAANLRQPVRMWETIEAVADAGYEVFVEIGPHPTLVADTARTLARRDGAHRIVASLRRDAHGEASSLEAAAELFAAGIDLAWSALYPTKGRAFPLPTYPWQRERHWVEDREDQPAKVRSRRQGLLGDATELASPPGARFWDIELTAVDLGLARDPQLGARSLVDSARLLEIVHLALEQQELRPDAGRFMRLRSPTPLLLHESVATQLQLHLRPSADAGGVEVSVFGRKAGGEADLPWQEHLHVTFERHRPGPDDDVGWVRAALASQTATAVEGDEPGRRFDPAFAQASPELASIRLVDGVIVGTRGGSEAGRDIAPARDGAASARQIHRGLAACVSLLGSDPAPGGLAAPPAALAICGWQQLNTHRSLSDAHHWLVQRRLPAAAGAALEVDVAVCDRAGHVLLHAEAVQLREIHAAQVVGLDSWLFRLDWEPLAGAPPSVAEPSDWVIVDDGSDVAASLLSILKSAAPAASRCARVRCGADDSGPDDGSALASALTAALPGEGTRCGVIFVAAAPSDGDARARRLASFVRVAQTLARSGRREMPRLHLVTAGAFRVVAQDATPAPDLAQLWGLVRTLHHDAPELRCTAVDLPKDAREPDDIVALAAWLGDDRGEDQIAVRGARLFGARLVRAREGDVGGAGYVGASGGLLAAGRARGTFVVDRADGEVALAVLEWLASSGADRLVCLTRRPPNAGWVEAAEARVAGRSALMIEVWDGASEAHLDATLERLDVGVIAGILQLARQPAPVALLAVDARRLADECVTASRETWLLHRLTRRHPVDLFLLFSGASSLLGAPGLLLQSALHAFSDGLAHLRRAEGLAAMSVNWGPWADVAGDGSRSAARPHAGFQAMTSRDALAILARAAAVEAAQLGILPIDSRQWFEYFPRAATFPILSALAKESRAAVKPAATSGLREALLDRPSEERPGLLADYVADQAAQVLRLPREKILPHAPFGAFGLDSLMTLELRNRLERGLGLTLSATLVWSYPTVADLAAVLLRRLGLEPEEPTAATAGASTADALTVDAEGELAALLAAADEHSESSLMDLLAGGSPGDGEH